MIAIDPWPEFVEQVEERARKELERKRDWPSRNGPGQRSLDSERAGVIGEFSARFVKGLAPFIDTETPHRSGRLLDLPGIEVRCRKVGRYELFLHGDEPPDALAMLFTCEEYPLTIYFRRWGVVGNYIRGGRCYSELFERPPSDRITREEGQYWIRQGFLEHAETMPGLRADWKECEGLRFVNTNGLPYSHPDFLEWRELADKHEARRRGVPVAELLTPAEVRRRAGKAPFFD